MEAKISEIEDNFKHKINQCYGAITSIQEQLNTIVGETQDARLNMQLAMSNLSVVLIEIDNIKRQLEEIKNGHK